MAFYRVLNPKRVKLKPRALKGIFVGYAENSKAYRILDLSSNVIVELRDIDFIENKFQNNSHKVPIDSNSVDEPTNVQNSNMHLNESLYGGSTYSNNKNVHDSPIEVRRSQRARKEKIAPLGFISSQSILFLVEGDRSIVLNKIPILFTVENDLKIFLEAMSSKDFDF